MVGEEFGDLALVSGDDALVAVDRNVHVDVAELVHGLAQGAAFEHEHGRVRGAQGVEGDVGPADLLPGRAELALDGGGDEKLACVAD